MIIPKYYNTLFCHCNCFPVGNKDDDPERKVVLTQDAQKFAEQMGIQLHETSAKENKNVEEVSEKLLNPLSNCLTLSQMASFRLFQIERVCR